MNADPVSRNEEHLASCLYKLLRNVGSRDCTMDQCTWARAPPRGSAGPAGDWRESDVPAAVAWFSIPRRRALWTCWKTRSREETANQGVRRLHPGSVLPCSRFCFLQPDSGSGDWTRTGTGTPTTPRPRKACWFPRGISSLAPSTRAGSSPSISRRYRSGFRPPAPGYSGIADTAC